MNNLDEIIKKTVLTELSELNYFSLGIYARKNHEILTTLYKNKVIDDNLLNKASEQIIKNQSTLDYKKIVKAKNNNFKLYADHVISPEILAYAIKNKLLLDTELKKIPFDHGDTIESFVKEYEQIDIFKILREDILNPKPFPINSEDDDDHY